MIASWSWRSMPQGTSTMLGRLMAGSHAVMAHEEAGQAVWVASHPPALHGSRVLLAYGQQVALATGRPLFVSDRAVHARALAGAFAAQGVGWLGMLDDHEQAGLESLEATVVDTLEEGTTVSRGPWQARRPADPRHVVIVAPTEGKTLVSWGTPQGQEALATTAWPRVSRERKEMQALSFKRMHDHGALKPNDGRQTILGPDRHPQRQREKLEQSLETAHQRVDTPSAARTGHQDQGAEAAAKGHGTRLEQRQRAWVVVAKDRKDAQHTQAKLREPTCAIGPPHERADRDVRPQTLMTMRTLLLENALMAFMGALWAHLPSQVRLDCR
jgi:hypothetical protein